MDLGIRVLMEIVWRVQIPNFTKERGYDVKPGDRVRVARGSHYKATGIVQSVDFPNACLTLKCDSGDTLVSTILLNAIACQFNFCNRSTFLFDL
jgi:hypothetical protein